MTIEIKEPELAMAVQIIEALLAVLPDSSHDDDESWGWCWDELAFGDGQEQVKEARQKALQFLRNVAAMREEIDGSEW